MKIYKQYENKRFKKAIKENTVYLKHVFIDLTDEERKLLINGTL